MTSQGSGNRAGIGSPMKLALAMVLLATLVVSRARSPSTWQRLGATQDVTSADVASCRAEAAQKGYGAVTTDDYLQRCMEAKGYRPSF